MIECAIYIVLCIPGVAPRIVLDASMLTKWRHGCPSYIVFCISKVATRIALDLFDCDYLSLHCARVFAFVCLCCSLCFCVCVFVCLIVFVFLRA